MNDVPILQIESLKTYFFTFEGVARAVDDVSFDLAKGEILGVVGESGCGKSVTAQSVMRLIPEPPGRIVQGHIRFDGRDLVTLAPEQMRTIRGRRIAMIFQEPMSSLNPVYTVGDQIGEMFRRHLGLSRRESLARAVEMLRRVQIPAPEKRVQAFPHQLSGGMRQRAMIAMALSCNPTLLIADEPTTALDVTIQAQILELMRKLQTDFETAIMVITHNLGVVAEMADRVAVMYMGKIVESGSVRAIFKNPMHPYTVGLMQSIPRLGRDTKRRLVPIAGSVPDPFSIPQGCAFYPRCPAKKKAECRAPEGVGLVQTEEGHWVRCTLYQ